jgi:hypothetical protein
MLPHEQPAFSNSAEDTPGAVPAVYLTQRPALDEHDFATVRLMYAEAQQWARHYEQLIVNANVLIVSACMIFIGLALGERLGAGELNLLLLSPIVISVFGMLLTRMLFSLYSTCIERLARIENLLNCFDAEKFRPIDGKGPLLDVSLARRPVPMPPSVMFFLLLYWALLFVFALLYILRAFV